MKGGGGGALCAYCGVVVEGLGQYGGFAGGDVGNVAAASVTRMRLQQLMQCRVQLCAQANFGSNLRGHSHAAVGGADCALQRQKGADAQRLHLAC